MVKKLLIEHKRIVTPFTLTIFIGWFIYGMIIIISNVFLPGWNPDPALVLEIGYIETLIGVFISLGSVFMIASEYRWSNISTSWLLDKIGMSLSAGGWFGYTMAVIMIDPSRIGAGMMGMIAMAALAARFYMTYINEQFVKSRIRRWTGLTHQL